MMQIPKKSDEISSLFVVSGQEFKNQYLKIEVGEAELRIFEFSENIF